MSSSIWPQAVADILDELGANPTPNEVYDALQNFDTRYAAAAVAAIAIAGGGGPGASVPFVGVDPPGSPMDGMLWWDPDDDTPSGGSQPIEVVRLTLAFNTPDLVLPPGVVICSLNPGDLLLLTGLAATSTVELKTAWDGNTPTLWLTTPAQIASTFIANLALDDSGFVGADFFGDGTLYQGAESAQAFGSLPPLDCTQAVDIVAFVDNGMGPGGGGEDPVSSQGELELVFMIARAI